MARRYGETRSQEIAVDSLPVVPARHNFASFINGPQCDALERDRLKLTQSEGVNHATKQKA
jgi:hypothetical protein